MKLALRRAGAKAFATVALAALALFGAAGGSQAGAIAIDSLLANASFETGTAGACPTSWVCGGSPSPGFAEYAPTSAQYTPGSDGLPSGSVPNGKNAVSAPTVFSGSGTLMQVTSGTWAAGQQYSFTFWIGSPKTEPDGTTKVSGPPATIRALILANGVTDNLSGSGPIEFDLTAPAPGDWQEITETFTPGQDFGQTIGVEFFVSTTNNDQSINFDIGPDPAVPEPASLYLLGGALLALCITLRRRLG
jgi:hypothetical protein